MNSDQQIPSNFILHYSQDCIQARVKELGAEVSAWVEDIRRRTGADVLTIPVLRGGIFFFADLVRQFRTSVDISPVRAWAYNASQNTQEDAVRLSLDGVAAERRSVLLVDDICDSGNSLHALTESFVKAGAHEVRSAVLVRRKLASAPIVPDYVGFEYEGDEWFVGYGMDDCDRWRNLPGIYIIKQGQ